MKRILKSDLDKFYTKKELAIDLISKVELNNFDIVVDPCCGDGSFYSNINHQNKIGIDILPHIDGVIKHDFLTWDYSCIKSDRSKVLVISNPPFGKQGSLAMNFIKRCSEFADTIGFILPLSFAKPSVKNKIPEYYHLEYEEILPEDSYLLDGENYDVKCVFQIWKKKSEKRDKIKSDSAEGFTYTKNKNIADIAIRRVGVYAGKAFTDLNKSEQSHYFLILEDKSRINLVIDELEKVTWSDLTVGPRSISKGELNKMINDILCQKN
jgi:predicted RNA methylase